MANTLISLQFALLSSIFYQELTQFLGLHPHKPGKKEHILKKKKEKTQTKNLKQTTKQSIFVGQKYFFTHITTNKKRGATFIPLWTLRAGETLPISAFQEKIQLFAPV